MRLAYKMEYIYPTEEDTGIEMVNYSSKYQEEYKKIYNDGYHKSNRQFSCIFPK